MEDIKAAEIAIMTGGELIQGPEDIKPVNVVMDSREAVQGSLFVALKGEVTDGHKFIDSAYENGARIFLISDVEIGKEFGKKAFQSEGASIIKVPDTLMGLQDLAMNYWNSLGMDSIAVTGSVGKTTVRDMLYYSLKTKYNVGVNKKNFNSETGFPLTLLTFTKDMEVGVLEMGMDALGQIERLAVISRPRVAVITNVGISHIERLGSRENIFKAKMEITEGFNEDNILIINNDDDMLASILDEDVPYRVIRVGTGEDCQYRYCDVKNLGIKGVSFHMITPEDEFDVSLPIPGNHNALNLALAVAGSNFFGVSPKEAVKGIMKTEMTGSRLKVIEKGGITIIDDAYNAAPSSMKSALETLKYSQCKRRIALLGGMNELGATSEEEHESVGAFAAHCDLDYLVTIGDKAYDIEKGYIKEGGAGKALHFQDKEEALLMLCDMFREGDMFLAKASRSFGLETVVQGILDHIS